MPANTNRPSDKNSTNPSVAVRRGTRRSSGSDTPSGPNTDRTSVPMKRENETAEDMDYSERSKEREH
jgi:hypothetical protein